MNADDFRDYTLSFLFLRYLSDHYEAAAKKKLGSDHPKVAVDEAVRSSLAALGRAAALAGQIKLFRLTQTS